MKRKASNSVMVGKVFNSRQMVQTRNQKPSIQYSTYKPNFARPVFGYMKYVLVLLQKSHQYELLLSYQSLLNVESTNTGKPHSLLRYGPYGW